MINKFIRNRSIQIYSIKNSHILFMLKHFVGGVLMLKRFRVGMCVGGIFRERTQNESYPYLYANNLTSQRGFTNELKGP